MYKWKVRHKAISRVSIEEMMDILFYRSHNPDHLYKLHLDLILTHEEEKESWGF